MRIWCLPPFSCCSRALSARSLSWRRTTLPARFEPLLQCRCSRQGLALPAAQHAPQLLRPPQESVEKLVDEWAASQPAVRAPKGEGSASRGGRQRRQPKRSAAATTGPAASTGTEAGSAASSRWTYAHKSPLEFALSPVETLADLKAMHIDWKVRARKFATLPTRPDIPVEVKRDNAALGRSSAARVPPGVASGNVLHIAGQVLTPGDDVVIVATLSAEEFVARLLRVTHAEAVVGLPDGSKARIPTLHLRRGRFTMTKLTTPGLPSLGPANDSPATPAPPPTSAAPPSLPPAPASQASATTTSPSQGHPPRTTSGPPPSSQTPPSSSAAGGLTPAVQAAMEAAARAGGALAPPLASGGTKRVREVGGGGGQAKRPRSGSSGSHVV